MTPRVRIHPRRIGRSPSSIVMVMDVFRRVNAANGKKGGGNAVRFRPPVKESPDA